MSFSYALREGLAGFRRASFAAVASTSAMTVALVLVGLFGVVTFEAQQVMGWLRQRVGELNVYLEEEAEDRTAETLRTRAATQPGVEETEYISHEEAQEIFQRDFGEDAAIYFDEPFLPASIKVRVTPAYANPDSLAQLQREMSTWNRVDEVVFNQPLVAKVQRNLRLLSTVGLALGTLVTLAALFLVANTIRLTVYARRLLIRTMKLVGATDRFVRRPFVVEGMVQGFVAGVLASLVLWGLFRLASENLPQLVGGRIFMLSVAALVILTGVLMGWLGSYFAVRRFVKNVALH